MKKCIMVICLCLDVMILLTGCSEESAYTYDDLSESDQAVIDMVYSERGMWEKIEGYPCRTASFLLYNGDELFVFGCL